MVAFPVVFVDTIKREKLKLGRKGSRFKGQELNKNLKCTFWRSQAKIGPEDQSWATWPKRWRPQGRNRGWKQGKLPVPRTGCTAMNHVLKGQTWAWQQPSHSVLCSACLEQSSFAEPCAHKQCIYFGGPISLSVSSRCSTSDPPLTS